MVQVLRYIFITLIFVSGVEITWGQDFSPVISGENGIPDARWPAIYYNTFDRVAVSLGMDALRDKGVSPNEKEIRVWIGGGITAPEQLYIIRSTYQLVEGEYYLYWRSGHGNHLEGETTHDLMKYNYTGQCENFTLKLGVGTCEVLFTEEPNWEEIVEKVTKADIWNLPDASKYGREPEVLEDGSVVIDLELDGWSITVELHDGQEYRSYQYSNPQTKDWPEATMAVKINSIITSVNQQMKPSNVRRNYKGVTSGKYRSAFKECESDETWAFRAAGNIEYYVEQAGMELPEPGEYGYLVEVIGTPTPEWLAKRWNSDFIRELQTGTLISIEPATSPNCK